MRRDLPTVLQHEDDSSGAVCLAMLLRASGRPAPWGEIRRACRVDRDGVSPADLAAAAEQFGLAAEVRRCEPGGLPRSPSIVQWRFHGYVVAEPAARGGWHVHDPVVGHRHCHDAEFDESFTGVAIVVGSNDAPRRYRAPGALRRAWALFGDLRPVAIYLAIIALLLIVPTLLVPRVIQQYSSGLMGGPAIAAGAAILGLLLAAVVTAALQALQAGVAVRVATRCAVVLDVRLVDRLLGLPLEFYQRRSVSSLTQRTALADELAGGMSALLLTGLTAALTGFAGTVALLVVDVWTGLTAIIVAGLSAVVVHRLLERDRDAVLRLLHEQLQIGVLTGSVFAQIVAVKAGGFEDAWIGRGLDAEHRLLRAEQRLALRSLVLRSAPLLLGSVGTVVITGVAAGRALAGEVPASSFAAVLVLSGLTISPLVTAAVEVERARTLAAALERIDDVLAEMGAAAPSAADQTDRRLSGAVELRGVSFAPNQWAHPLLTDIDLAIEPGQWLIVAGTPGAGCSTLALLLAGVVEPSTGAVEFDGIAASRLRAGAGQVAVVRQDLSTVETSWLDNVTLTDPDLSEASIDRAVTVTGVREAAARHPEGMDAGIDSWGTNVAAGEWSLLGVARAFARDPQVLVLDATLQTLDAATAVRLAAEIRARGITCIVLGPPTPLAAPDDEVVVLDAGRIIAHGTHARLLRERADYRAAVGG